MKPRHIYPLNDWREHEIDGHDCWCKPEIIDGIYVHNSMDGREHYEDETRKMN